MGHQKRDIDWISVGSRIQQFHEYVSSQQSQKRDMQSLYDEVKEASEQHF